MSKINRILQSIFVSPVQMIITYLPGSLGYKLRYMFWKKRLGLLGINVVIEPGAHFHNPQYIEIDDNCWIDRDVIIMAGPDNSTREKVVRQNNSYPGKPGTVFIGKDVHVAPFCIISGISAGVYVSDGCGFSSGCKVYSFSNHFRSAKAPWDKSIHFGPRVPDNQQCIVEGPVFIGGNTGIALNCILLPGVSIPNDCFVAINSVVVGGKFEENSIISGNPATATGKRFHVKKDE